MMMTGGLEDTWSPTESQVQGSITQGWHLQTNSLIYFKNTNNSKMKPPTEGSVGSRNIAAGLHPDDLKIYWIVEKGLIWAEVVRHADGLRFVELLQEDFKSWCCLYNEYIF